MVKKKIGSYLFFQCGCIHQFFPAENIEIKVRYIESEPRFVIGQVHIDDFFYLFYPVAHVIAVHKQSFSRSGGIQSAFYISMKDLQVVGIMFCIEAYDPPKRIGVFSGKPGLLSGG